MKWRKKNDRRGNKSFPGPKIGYSRLMRDLVFLQYHEHKRTGFPRTPAGFKTLMLMLSTRHYSIWSIEQMLPKLVARGDIKRGRRCRTGYVYELTESGRSHGSRDSRYRERGGKYGTK